MRLRLFHLVLRLDRWTRTRFTPTGRLLLAALVAVGLFAINPRATLAWQLAIIVLAVVLSSMLWALAFRPRVRLTRRLPRFGTADSSLRYSLLIENLGSRPLYGLELCDYPEAGRLTRHGLRGSRGDGGREGWFDRRMGYVRFTREVESVEGVRCMAARLPVIAPGATEIVSVELAPRRRGYVSLAGVRVNAADPLGVFRARVDVALAARLLVLPRRYPVSWHGAGGTSRRPRPGHSRSRIIGAGADFARLREYRPRDSLRHIHWRAWARLGEPVVKEFHEESPSRNALVLDTFAPSDATRAAFEEAVSVAASFVADSGWRSGRLDLLFAGETTVHLEQGSEGEGVGRMLEALACVERSRAPGFEALAEAVVQRLGGFSTCVLVLLDWDAPRRALARAMRAAGVSTLVFVVGDAELLERREVGPSAADAGPVHPVTPGNGARVLAHLSESTTTVLERAVNA